MAPSWATMEAQADALLTPAARIAAFIMRRGMVRVSKTLWMGGGEEQRWLATKFICGNSTS